MFDVIHNDGTLYTVYHIKENPITGIEFLVYDDSMGWIWENARNFIPVGISVSEESFIDCSAYSNWTKNTEE